MSYDEPWSGYTFEPTVGGGRQMGGYFGVNPLSQAEYPRYIMGHRVRIDWEVYGNPLKCGYRQHIARNTEFGVPAHYKDSYGEKPDTGGDVTTQIEHGDFIWTRRGASFIDAPGHSLMLPTDFPGSDAVTLWDYCIDSNGNVSKKLESGWKIRVEKPTDEHPIVQVQGIPGKLKVDE
ncbi:MAG: hypothetical protein HC927_09585 [Deltaproteobacteria bacterium]|nr:hypothetical protein [Deltaproteobacteria bacterium]